MNKLIIAISILFTNFFACGEEVFRIPFYNSTNDPLVILEKNEYVGGIYVDSFKEILKGSKIKYELLPVPKSRTRQHFWEGRTMFSCCENPSWRSYPKEIEVQLFSNPFLELKEFLVTKKDSNIKVKNLSDVHVALFRGYSYKGDSTFGKVTYLKEMEKMVKFVELDRAEATIVTEHFFLTYLKNNPKSQLKASEVFSVDKIHIRVHKSRKEFLPVINKEILKLKKKGFFKEVVKRYIK
jgi:hypothetical protein